MTSLELVIVNGLVAGGILILMALGMTLIFGVMDIINFAHGVFFTLGAYIAYVLNMTYGVNLIVSIVVAALVVGVLGVIVDQTLIRKVRDESVWVTFLVTLGFGYALQEIIEFVMGSDPRYFKIDIGTVEMFGLTYGIGRLSVTIVSFLLIGLTFVFLNRTMTGKQIRAVAQNDVGSRLVGIDSNRIYLLTFGIGSLLAGFAGALNGILFPLSPTMGEIAIINAFIVIIIGGLGSISGAAIAGLFLGMVQSVSSVYLSNSQVALLFYAVLIVTLVVRPQGIMAVAGEKNV